MIQKIQNTLTIGCDEIDLTSVSQLEFYVRQGGLELVYTPEVIDEHSMMVTVPFEDALALKPSPVRMQFTFVDANGNPRASEIVQRPVGELLKEAGYDPI